MGSKTGEGAEASPAGKATESGKHAPNAYISGVSAPQRIADRQLHFDVFADPVAEVGSPRDSSVPNYPRGADTRWDIRPGDAFHLIDKIDDYSVDLIITSPPYWGQRTYGLKHNWHILDEWEQETGHRNSPPWDWYRKHGGVLGLEPLPEWYVDHLVSFFSKAMVKLKDHGSIWVNIGDTYFARWASIRDDGRQGLGNNDRIRRRTPMGRYLQEKQLLLVPARFAIAMENERWILRNDLIWFKPNVPPRPEKDRLRLAHEHFFHFVKRPKEGRAKYYYDLAEVEEYELDVVKCNVRPGRNGHSATFPAELIRPRILSSSPPDGLVLDPFCGTGSALLCAAEAGRSALGFELSGKFISDG